MNDKYEGLTPPQRLALAYAPKNVRVAFGLLLEFDAKVRGIVLNANEILIGQLKLAWWREAVLADPSQRPKGEPLLARISNLTEQDVGPDLEMLLTAWEELLVGEGSVRTLQAFAQARGTAIFGGYMRLIGAGVDVEDAGTQWALRDLKGHDGDGEVQLPRERRVRPLAILSLSVCDVSGPRMIWRALTGR